MLDISLLVHRAANIRKQNYHLDPGMDWNTHSHVLSSKGEKTGYQMGEINLPE